MFGQYISRIVSEHSELHKEFIFTVPGFNTRSTELNAVIGLNQLRRLGRNIEKRRGNFIFFMQNLDLDKYYTDFDMEGNSNYAYTVLLREKDSRLYERVIAVLEEEKVEFRRGMAGDGNVVRQLFVQERYPDLEREKIAGLCEVLNAL